MRDLGLSTYSGILSDAIVHRLQATLLYEPMDYVSKPHGNYSGLDAFHGMGRGEWSRAAALAVWPNLTTIDLPR